MKPGGRVAGSWPAPWALNTPWTARAEEEMMDWLTEETATRGQLLFSWACFWVLAAAFIVLAVAARRHERRASEAEAARAEAEEINERLERRVRLHVDREIHWLERQFE